MNLRPAHWLGGGMKPWVAGAERGSIWLPLEVISPRSAEGRKAHLYRSEEDLTKLLKELKKVASYHRGQKAVLEAESWESVQASWERAPELEGPIPPDAFTGASDDYA